MNTCDDEQLTPSEEAELDRLGASFTPAQYAELEGELRLRAHVIGWRGDLLQQPGRVVLNIARSIAAVSRSCGVEPSGR